MVQTVTINGAREPASTARAGVRMGSEMTFAFDQQSGVQGQIRSIAIQQVDRAVAACRGDDDFDAIVHGVRRRCKKLRGLLRLIEPGFEGFDTENKAVRAAAAGLSGTRDAAVMGGTFEALLAFDRAEGREGRIKSGSADAITAMLQRRAGEGALNVDRRRLLDAFCETMTEVGERARSWRIKGRGFAAIAGGFELTYRRLAAGTDAAAAPDATAEALHEWRKHAKYHWHHVSLFTRAAPDLLGDLKHRLDQLAELLGDHHNLHVLGEHLAADPDLDSPAAERTLGDVIAERQAVLADHALALGRQLTVEKPGAIGRRFKHYWQLLPEKG